MSKQTTWGLEDTVVNSECSFSLIHPSVGTVLASNQEVPKGTNENSHWKSYPSPAKGPQKGQRREQVTFTS